MTDQPRRQGLGGAVEVQPGAAFLPSWAQVQESARIYTTVCVFWVYFHNKLHNTC